MNNKQVMQQALEALIDAANVLSAPMFADAVDALKAALEQQAEPVAMRMPKVGDKVICLEDESLGEVVSLTAGGSPDILFGDGSRGTYLLREFAELFGYVNSPAAQPKQKPMHPELRKMWEDYFDKCFRAQPEQEPVCPDCKAKVLFECVACSSNNYPPKRPWVGLTDEEVQFCALKHRQLVNAYYDAAKDTNVITAAFEATVFYETVEQALKERNYEHK